MGPHSLAEIAGTAGHEGQRADVGMADVKRGSQQCLTAVIHTLGCGPGARAGGWQGHAQPLDFTSPMKHPNLGPRERRRRMERRRKGCGHQQPWSPAASDYPRSRQETNLSQTLGLGLGGRSRGVSPGATPAWFPGSAAGMGGGAGRRSWDLEAGWEPAPASCARTPPHRPSASL